MAMGCSDCGCEVEAGKRVVVCGQDGCCCQHVPAAPGATGPGASSL